MPWKSQKDEWGVSKEEMQDLVSGHKELPTKFEEIKTAMETSKSETNTAISGINNTLQAMNDRLEQALKGKGKAGKGEEGGEGEPQYTSVIDDEDSAFQQRLTPVVIRQLKLESQIKRDKILRKFPYGELLRDEIDKVIDAQHPSAQIDEKLIENTYKVIYQDNLDEINKAKEEKKGRFFLESSRSHGNSNPEKDHIDSKPVITDEEKRVARKWGITDEQYLEQKKGMKYV